jgi:hypothetical protein
MCPYFSDPPPPKPRLLTKAEVTRKIKNKLTSPAMVSPITIERLPQLLGEEETKCAKKVHTKLVLDMTNKKSTKKRTQG